jgi:hypothetical protein
MRIYLVLMECHMVVVCHPILECLLCQVLLEQCRKALLLPLCNRLLPPPTSTPLQLLLPILPKQTVPHTLHHQLPLRLQVVYRRMPMLPIHRALLWYVKLLDYYHRMTHM